MLATTTSIRDAGLLDAILPGFERASGTRVRVIAVGSGHAMELGRRGEADILVLHDPVGEEAFMTDGFGLERSPLMHNEFVIVGPPTDPAGVRGASSAARALTAIGRARALFISRGDRSGTSVKEQRLWRLSGVRPERVWYRESGQGMSATLQIANELRAYTLTDIGTFLSHRPRLDLEILVEGDSALHNPYHVIVIDDRRFEWVNAEGAQDLKEYLIAAATQEAIGEFGREQFGRSLFVPDAGALRREPS